jgi:hypothetical protein
MGRRRRSSGYRMTSRKDGYWKLNEEAPSHMPCRTHSGKGYGLVKRQTMEFMN